MRPGGRRPSKSKLTSGEMLRSGTRYTARYSPRRDPLSLRKRSSMESVGNGPLIEVLAAKNHRPLNGSSVLLGCASSARETATVGLGLCDPVAAGTGVEAEGGIAATAGGIAPAGLDAAAESTAGALGEVERPAEIEVVFAELFRECSTGRSGAFSVSCGEASGPGCTGSPASGRRDAEGSGVMTGCLCEE